MTTSPKIPKDQQSFADHGAQPVDADVMRADRRDRETEAQSGQPGDADVNIDQQGRFGNAKQNLTPQHKAQNR